MRTARTLAVLIVVLGFFLSAVGDVFAKQTPSIETKGLNHAGLVIRHGDGRVVYAYVSFPEESISGIDLLRRSGVSLVTVGFGGLGEGVCTIDDEGCPAGDCRARVCQGNGADAPFWQYFRQRTSGDWVSLSLGASATKVRDGDIDGWSWTGHDAGLPALSLADIQSQFASDQISAVNAAPTAVIRTIFPAGYAAPDDDADQSRTTWIAGVGVLVVLVGAGIWAIRRRPQIEDAP